MTRANSGQAREHSSGGCFVFALPIQRALGEGNLAELVKLVVSAPEAPELATIAYRLARK